MAHLSDMSDSFGLAKGIFTPPVHLAKIRTMTKQNFLDVPPMRTKKIRFMLKNNFFCLFLLLRCLLGALTRFVLPFPLKHTINGLYCSTFRMSESLPSLISCL